MLPAWTPWSATVAASARLRPRSPPARRIGGVRVRRLWDLPLLLASSARGSVSGHDRRDSGRDRHWRRRPGGAGAPDSDAARPPGGRLGHAGLDPEGRVDIGDPPRLRGGHPLDRPSGTPLPDALAFELKDHLESFGYHAFCKTKGREGIHVVAPLTELRIRHCLRDRRGRPGLRQVPGGDDPVGPPGQAGPCNACGVCSSLGYTDRDSVISPQCLRYRSSGNCPSSEGISPVRSLLISQSLSRLASLPSSRGISPAGPSIRRRPDDQGRSRLGSPGAGVETGGVPRGWWRPPGLSVAQGADPPCGSTT